MAAKYKEPDPDTPDEEYDSNDDEDFNPEAAPAADDDVSASSASDEEDETTTGAKKSKKKPTKRKAPEPTEEELDSGDEATIKERKRKKRKGKEREDDSGGEGGLIKTRAQRLVEKAERKERKRADRGEVTVDVDDLWARLHAVPVGRYYEPVPQPADGEELASADNVGGEVVQPADQLIRIKRRIAFAGEITEIEEEVLKSSAAAQAYLAEHPEADPANTKSQAAATGQQAASDGHLQRPLRRPSMFEPNPTAAVRGVSSDKLRPRAPSRLDVLMTERRSAEENKKKAERMSTVQKSAVDWKGFVADQGIGEELDVYGKSKGGFMAREQFLDRVAGANEEARRAARLKG